MTASTPDVVRRPVWSPPAIPAAPRATVARALLAGAAGATVAVAPLPGAGMFVAALVVTAAVWPATRGRRDAGLLGWGASAVLLASVLVVRDAPWLVAMDLVGAFGVASLALARPRTLAAHVLAASAVVIASVPAVGWLMRGVRLLLANRRPVSRPLLRGIAVAVPLLLVFGALFASADAVFGRLLAWATPSVTIGETPMRVGAFMLAAGLVCAAGYVLTVRPRFDEVLDAPRRLPARAEWTVPLASLVAMVAVFVTVQVRTWLGGDAYVRSTAGLSYADYARSGFFQLLAASVLTLAVIAVAVRWVPRESRADAITVKALLGALSLLTLVVLASAARRLALYDAAYGLTRLRVVVAFGIGWIAVLFLLVLAAGLVRRAAWLPSAVVASMVAGLLLLTAINPDARIAQSNVQRYAAVGRIDSTYLGTLSDDALPVVLRLPTNARNCVLAAMWARRGGRLVAAASGWESANLARSFARRAVEAAAIDGHNLAERNASTCGVPT